MSWGMMAAGHIGWAGPMDEGWRKGPWTAEEDQLLTEYVRIHGEGRWNSVARLAGLKRNGKSCRLRWVNYLRPDLKRGQITPNEESIILELHARWGNRWSTIARSLPGRTDNEIKNYWRTHFKKKSKISPDNSLKARSRLLKKQQFHHHHQQQQQQQQQLLMQQEQQQYQQGLQQLNQLDMKTIMFLLDEKNENKAPYNVPQMRQEVNPIYNNNSCEEQVYNFEGPSLSYVSSEDILLWDGLWSLDDVNANIGVESAPTNAYMQI